MDNEEVARISDLPLDDQFKALLHKKLLSKTGSCKRRMKKYYEDKYSKNGIIPAPLQLLKKGIVEGRKCSGRPRSLTEDVQKRFIEMVKASCDHDNDGFIFISKKMRSISNFHNFLEDEFSKTISLGALRHFANKENLKLYLTKPDYDEPPRELYYFDSREVFELIQVDGCIFRYFKIRNSDGNWEKPQVIEFFDTGSRKMFVLDVYFSESSMDSVDLFTQFLLSTPFPYKEISLRPDQAGGFKNLKRPIQEINLNHSLPDGFCIKPDFARQRAPKHKAHLESSHRSLHFFEARIIKYFEKKIAGKEPGKIYKNGKFETISVTLLDIDIEDLKASGLIEEYRQKHNSSKHNFSQKGMVKSWIPNEVFMDFMSKQSTFSFSADKVEGFMKYGFKKVQATVTAQKRIRFGNQDFFVAEGIEHFSSHKSTKVKISRVNDKLLIFEDLPDGVFIGEAVPQKKHDHSTIPEKSAVKKNEVEQIADFLEQKGFLVDQASLSKARSKGLTLDKTRAVYQQHRKRYEGYAKKVSHPDAVVGKALFNSFLLDFYRHQQHTSVAPYATYKEQ